MANKRHIFFPHNFFFFFQYSTMVTTVIKQCICDFYSIYFGWDIKQREVHKNMLYKQQSDWEWSDSMAQRGRLVKTLVAGPSHVAKTTAAGDPRVSAPGWSQGTGKSDCFFLEYSFTWIRCNIVITWEVTLRLLQTVLCSFLRPLLVQKWCLKRFKSYFYIFIYLSWHQL